MTRRRSLTPLILAAGVGMAATVGAGAWVLTREPSGPACRLKDGSLLELKGVSYGNRHRLLEQRLWQKLLEPLLPPALQGREVAVVGTPVNQLVLWFLPVGGPRGWHPPRWLEAVDEDGCCIGRGVEYGGFPASIGAYRVGTLEAFPRRAGRFQIRVYERGAAAPVAEFTVANPAPGPYPIWQPDPVPIEKRRGGLTVRLTALTTGARPSLRQTRPTGQRDGRHPSVAAAGLDRDWTLASFRIAENGAPTGRWRFARIALSDATGNTASYRPAGEGVGDDYFGFGGGNSNGTVSFQPLNAALPLGTDRAGSSRIAFPGLCPREAAWKLRATFAYAGPEALHPADLHWTISPGLAVPAPGRVHSGVPFMGKGAALRLQVVLGRGAFGTDKPLLRDANVRVIVTSPKDDGLTLALRATDDQGRAVVCSRAGSVSMGLYHKWWFDLKTRPAAKRMTLTFAGWKSRSVEFLARPTPA